MIKVWQSGRQCELAFAVLCFCAILQACGGGTTVGPPVDHFVQLNWNPSTSAVAGYFVYRSMTSGGPYGRISATLNDTTFTDTNVSAGQTYFYVLTAVAANNLESEYSNEISALIPSP